jgi:hypothetical protein
MLNVKYNVTVRHSTVLFIHTAGQIIRKLFGWKCVACNNQSYILVLLDRPASTSRTGLGHDTLSFQMHPVKPPSHYRCQGGRMLPTASLQAATKKWLAPTLSLPVKRNINALNIKKEYKSLSLCSIKETHILL